MPEPINSIISPWRPEQEQVRLAVLGKLIEECNELAGRAARCIIHGLDERDPTTGRLNRDELAREMSDVVACIETVEGRLAVKVITARVADKYDGFRRWHSMIEDRRHAGQDTDREAFEADLLSRRPHTSLAREADGQYRQWPVQMAWEGWQAAASCARPPNAADIDGG